MCAQRRSQRQLWLPGAGGAGWGWGEGRGKRERGGGEGQDRARIGGARRRWRGRCGARAPARSLPPGPRVGTHTEGRGQAARERRGGVVRPPMPPPPPGLALPLPEPPAPPSLPFPKPVQGRRPRRRAQVPPYGKRSLMTSRDGRSLCPSGSRPPGKTSRVWARPAPNRGDPGRLRRRASRGKIQKQK